MTWQRIDENTYIDDSLVTCAEYQLFIDEMREQGKYFQPDHWTSYQFPRGRAREQILGVRYSDAVAFCNWLTSRGTDKWKYRLPTHEEAINLLLRVAEQSSFGYWVNDPDHQSKFALTGVATDDIRGITQYPDLEHDIALDPTLVRSRAPQLVHARTQALNRDYSNIILRSCVRPVDLELSCAAALQLASNLNKDIAENRTRYPNLVQDIVNDLNRANKLVLRRDNSINLAFARTILRDIVIALDTDIAADLAKNANYDLTTLRSTLAFALELYFDIFTIQERIAGRSPAFEGIRLVKERK